jgi:murein DD-endopeptidase MepM/ murein hydrolase activator NlpD
MVRRPYQQATRPDQGRQRSPRSRSFTAGAIVLATLIVVAVGMVLAPRGSDPILGAEPSATATPPVVSEVLRQLAQSMLAAVLDVPLPDASVRTASGSPGPSTGAPASPAASADVATGSPGPSAAPSPAPSDPAPGGRPWAAPPTSAEPEDLKGYTWPLYQGRMTNFFGPRDNGFLVVDGQRIHAGLDTTTFCGDQVKAAHIGVVVAVGRQFLDDVGFSGPLDSFYRRIDRRHSLWMQPIVVVVDDGNGYRSMYVHLSKALVKVGDKVRHKTVIGLEGQTGNANGCHVHYELVRMDGPWMRIASDLVKQYGYPQWQRERVDPLRVLDLKAKRAGRFVPGILRPKLSESLRPSRSPSP